MKPLTLHVYPKDPDMDAYRVGGFYSPYCLVSADKRFTDAELAAEWWACHGDANAIMTSNPTLLFSRRQVFLRMATLPHASDSDYE